MVGREGMEKKKRGGGGGGGEIMPISISDDSAR